MQNVILGGLIVKVLLFMAKGVELIEASAFIDVFGWHRDYSNGKIEIVTCSFNKEIRSTFDIALKVDILINQVKIDEYDALAIPGGFGGYGFYEDAYNDKFLKLIREFNDSGKLIASICVGALPIGKSGVLKGRKGTTYHLMNKRRQIQLEEFGVKIVNESVVIDENVITSWCPSTAIEVALKLLEMLTNANESKEIRKIMGY